MHELPPPTLLNTFRLAVVLKLVGVATALGIAWVSIHESGLARWWMAIVTGLLLLLLLLPWPQRFPAHLSWLAHSQLITALLLAIVAPHLDLIQSLHIPYDPLANHPLFVERFNWSPVDVNRVHAFGQFFVVVPIILASWQYGRWGMWSSLGLSAVWYIGTPFALPSDSFAWDVYAVRGFVLLGTSLIAAFTVWRLAAAQRQEQANVNAANVALAAANEKLAQQAIALEELATSRERNRLARELHDTLAHSLSGTAVQLQAVNTLLKVDQVAAVAELHEAQQQIKRGLEEARRAIAALRATPLEELGLAAALQQRCQQISQRSGIPVHCQMPHHPIDLPPRVEQAFYRVADEALINAEKYAQASQIEVNLQQKDSSLCLIVQDDGCGFGVDEVLAAAAQPDNHHFGLVGMQERANLINAALTITSQPWQGTQIQLCLLKKEFNAEAQRRREKKL